MNENKPKKKPVPRPVGKAKVPAAAPVIPPPKDGASALPEAQPPLSAILASVNLDDAPRWVTEAFYHFAGKDFGEDFEDAVASWVRLERGYGWETSVRCLPA